jgi:hypothetical protein
VAVFDVFYVVVVVVFFIACVTLVLACEKR